MGKTENFVQSQSPLPPHFCSFTFLVPAKRVARANNTRHFRLHLASLTHQKAAAPEAALQQLEFELEKS